MAAHITVLILADAGEFNKVMDESDLRMDAFGSHGSSVGNKLANDMSNSMSKMGKGVGGVFEKLGNSMTNLGIPFGTTLTKMGTQISSVDSKFAKLGGTLKVVGALTLALGSAAAIGIGAESLHLYDQYEKALVGLETAVKNSGHSWAAFQTPLANTTEKMVKLGFTSSETAGAIAQLTTATNSPAKALADLSTPALMACLASRPYFIIFDIFFLHRSLIAQIHRLRQITHTAYCKNS